MYGMSYLYPRYINQRFAKIHRKIRLILTPPRKFQNTQTMPQTAKLINS